MTANAQPVTSTQDIKVVKPPVLCQDPAVSNLNITKSLANNTATFTITGKVCNNGPGDYNQPANPLEAHFNILCGLWSDVQLPGRRGGQIFHAGRRTGPEEGGNASLLPRSLHGGKVLQWGFKEPKPNEKQMKLLFEFFVRDAKGTLGTVSQPKGLDCNLNNNLLSQTFEMMVSITNP